MACNRALSESYLQPHQIDLLLYVGVGRGFIEPSNSHMMANALGFSNAQCFDIVDACMSWVRALQLVDSLFKTGPYRNALIINAEFNVSENSFLDNTNFKLGKEEEILYTFPYYTIGEAATATLLIPSDPDNFEFYFSAKQEFSDLCTIPVSGFKGFCHPTDKIGARGPMQFTSFGIDLHKFGNKEIVRIFDKLSKKEETDIIFVHSSSKNEWDKYATQAGVQDRVFHTYSTTGNIVSASIPTAIDQAEKSGKLTRGKKAALWVGSAGMSFNATKFAF